MKVAVLISGRGSNLEALLKHQKNYTIVHVISNNFSAQGIATAQKYGVTNTCINWSDRCKAEKTLVQVAQESQADLIVLAGFMRILSAHVLSQFDHKIINIHPSLLPKYPGLKTHQKVLDNKDKLHGATVHLVDDQLDHGRILAQTQFEVGAEKDANKLADRLILKEHKLLTTVMSLIGSKELTWDHENTYMQNKTMTQPLKLD